MCIHFSLFAPVKQLHIITEHLNKNGVYLISIMSIGSVYETAYKGDFNQVKVRTDQDTSLVKTPDSVSSYLIPLCRFSSKSHYNNSITFQTGISERTPPNSLGSFRRQRKPG